mmetsp:Transcript_96831/g.283067  ORF Transcript_96831/g.283067 Transcript_96831/m.283067 type:complete len:344 (+) Transcript_96831:156-1187(+)
MPKGERRRSRSRSPPDGGRGSLEQRLRSFRRRYPADDRAFEFLDKSHPKVVEQVLADWKPPHENQDDYSALLTNFVRQVRNRLGCHGRQRHSSAQERGGPEAAEGSDGASEEEAGRDPQGDRGLREGRSTLRELVAEVGAVLGRGQEDVEPFVSLLEENWFDTVESLEEVSAQDLAAVGLPLRFARELVLVAGRKTSGVDLAPAVYTGQEEKGRGKGGDKGKGKSKGKGKGKGKTKGKGKGKDRDWDDRDDHELVRTIPVKLNGLHPEEKKGRLLGSGGEHFKYIRSRTKAEVWLEGSGSGHGDSREPLCVWVRAESRSKLDHAVELVEDLLAMVAKESRRHR